jgi:hypothetical protein
MKLHLKNKQHQRRGIALMLVMVAILVTGGMAVAYFGSRDNSIAISSNVESAAKARAVAESGLDLAVAILETDADWRTEHVDGVILDDFAFSGGTITLTVTDSETDLPPTASTNEVEIKILSSIGGISQTTQATATIVPDEDEFDVDYSEFALFTQSQLTIRDIASVQQWHASPLGSQANPVRIGTLATSPLAIQINTWGGNDDLQLHTTTNASSMVSNSLTSDHEMPRTAPFPQPPSPPQDAKAFEFGNGNDNDNDTSSVAQWAQNFTHGFNDPFGNPFNNHSQQIDVLEGSYEVESLNVGSNKQIVIHGDVTLTISNDLTLNATSIELEEGATLTIHVGGDVNINSSYIGNTDHTTNSWSDPSRLQLFGHNDSNWDLRGITTIKGEIYAPESEIEMSGLSTLCGRIASDEITLRGASRVLYDQTLDHGGYADESSSLYNDDGTLIDGLQQLVELDPVLIDSLQEAASSIVDNEYRSWQDWWSFPTARPNEVIYAMMVYGVDARRWESLARQARRLENNGNTFHGNVNSSDNSSDNTFATVFGR